MKSRWSESEASSTVSRYVGRCNADVALRVYSSRLLGSDPSLVLHGGGNTSVKTVVKDDLGRDATVLCVKGSGWDLSTLEPRGLPALRLDALQELRALASLSDEAMVNAQRIRMLDASGPNPSVETLLHAFLPHKYIDHSHADAILSLVDQEHAEALCAEVFGQTLGVVPYIMPGFALAKLAAEVYERTPSVQGLLLLQHGLFTFGATAQESYDRHLAAVDAAERFCEQRRAARSKGRQAGARPVDAGVAASPRDAGSARVAPSHGGDDLAHAAPPALRYEELAPVLRGLLGEEDRRYALCLRDTPITVRFASDPRVDALSQRGCATPDHVIRTKRWPLRISLPPCDADRVASLSALRVGLSAQLADYRAEYSRYVARNAADKRRTVTPLDPDPRVFLVPGLGLITAGDTPKAASIAADIYEHTISVIDGAESVDAYRALPEGDLFDMEYWSLEQAKLGSERRAPLSGRIVYITGAASGIGAATARAFAQAGAVLYLVDRSAEPLLALAAELRVAHEVVDLSDERAVRASVEGVVRRYGGLDGVVSNAGTAPQGVIAEVSTAQLVESFAINLYAHHWVASAATAVMKAQGRGGFLLFNASKAAFNPGAGFGPYALPKAALIALMKQYALELGEHRIRSNAVNADRIRTRLLDQDDVATRAQARGLSPEDYYRANLLGSEVSAEHVAAAFVTLALAERTTGSVLTVDGGNIAASPR